MEEREHNIKMEARKYMEITGVIQADSSEENLVNLKTAMGDMVIKGEGLQIRHLDLTNGKAVVSGKIDAVAYPQKDVRGKGGAGKLRKLFK